MALAEEQAVLIGLDWGSTSLRAFLVGAQGDVLDTRSSAAGASTLLGAPAFEAALNGVLGDWQQRGLPMLACGMVGSKHGWREAAYARCPADVSALAAQSVRAGLAIVPGLIHAPADAPPDVMRGEETQIFGALALHPQWAEDACIVLPGTHSKWARVEAGRVTGFATHMTGELYALLRTQSVLGRLMVDGPSDDAAFAGFAAFEAGVDAAREGAGLGLAHQLFAVRTLGLTERWPGSSLADYLSGLLIGDEVRAGIAAHGAPRLLIGEVALCARYATALQRFGVSAPLTLNNTAPTGLWTIATAMGLLT